MTKHSSHIFLFPFSFTGDFNTLACKAESEGSNWQKQDFNKNSADRYNQKVYFHDYAEDVLFRNDDTVRSYEFKDIGANGRYYIYIKEEKENRLFDLTLAKITLNVYNTHVGVLSFFLDNYSTDNKEDILKINDYGRRIFPQFLTDSENPVLICRCNFLALSITLAREVIPAEMITIPDPAILGNDEAIITYEDFNYYASFKTETENPTNSKHIKLANHIIKILGEKIFCDESGFNHGLILIKPIIDDRMFVISGYVGDSIIHKLNKYTDGHYGYEQRDINWVELSTNDIERWSNNEVRYTDQDEIIRKDYDFWYRYIFIDTNQATSQSFHQITKLIKKHTYDRWINWGTLYGVSRYSFVLLTSSQYEFDNKLNKHLTNLYFNIVLLCIVERSSVLQFSERVSKASGFFDPKKITKAEIEKISRLYYDYINFINKIYLREITAQEQGIELYDMLMEKMHIKLEVENLDNEISELHTYVSMIEDRKRNIKMADLNNMAVLFLPASLIATILGISFISDNTSFDWLGKIDQKIANSLILIGAGGLITSGLLWLLLNAGSYAKKITSLFSKKLKP